MFDPWNYIERKLIMYLVSATRPLARAPDRMSQPELVKLRKKLKELLDMGLLQPAKSPYDAPILFQEKHV